MIDESLNKSHHISKPNFTFSLLTNKQSFISSSSTIIFILKFVEKNSYKITSKNPAHLFPFAFAQYFLTENPFQLLGYLVFEMESSCLCNTDQMSCDKYSLYFTAKTSQDCHITIRTVFNMLSCIFIHSSLLG